MVKHDGISEKTVESDQNVKIEELEQDEDQSFESDLVVVDDSEDVEEEPVVEAPSTDGAETKKQPPMDAGRILADESEDISVVYDMDGYDADAEELSVGIEIDDPAMAEGLSVPEDQVDPDTGYTYTSNQDEAVFSMYWFVAGGLAILALVAIITYACLDKGIADDETDLDAEAEMQDMSQREMVM